MNTERAKQIAEKAQAVTDATLLADAIRYGKSPNDPHLSAYMLGILECRFEQLARDFAAYVATQETIEREDHCTATEEDIIP